MTHHRLIIMRHAKSDWSTNAMIDFDRPLSGRGIKNAGKMGKWLKQSNIFPDVITSSPAKRAKQTIMLVCEQLAIPSSTIIFDERIYGASLTELLEVVSDHGQRADNLLVVGHNPGFDTLLTYLSSEQPRRSDNGKLMTTAAVAILDYGEGPINVSKQSGKLEQLVRPKEV